MAVERDAVLTNAGTRDGAVNFEGQYVVTSIDLGKVCVCGRVQHVPEPHGHGQLPSFSFSSTVPSPHHSSLSLGGHFHLLT